jgi:hypothetical protein
MSTTALRRRMGLLLLLVLTILINIAQFTQIDRHRSPYAKAIYRFDTSDIVVLALRLPNVQQTANLYGALRETALGVTLLVPKNQRISASFAIGVITLSRAKLVRREISPLPDPNKFADSIVAQGKIWGSPRRARIGKPGARWAIATGPCPASEMLVLKNDSFEYFLVDTSLLKNGQPASCPAR